MDVLIDFGLLQQGTDPPEDGAEGFSQEAGLQQIQLLLRIADIGGVGRTHVGIVVLRMIDGDGQEMAARLQQLNIGLHIADVGGGSFPDERQRIGGFHPPPGVLMQFLQTRVVSTDSFYSHGLISSPSHSISAVAASLKPTPRDTLTQRVSKRLNK